jgi:hypothetical protein
VDDPFKPLTWAELEKVIDDLPKPGPDIRVGPHATDDLRALFPASAEPAVVRLFGIPLVVDPILPDHFVAIIGPPEPFDPADPLKPDRSIRFIDLRNVSSTHA